MIDLGNTQGLLPWNEDGSFAYVSVGREGQDVPGVIALGARYQLGLKEAARSNGVYVAQDERITFDLAALVEEYSGSAIVPKVRDRITPPGEERERVVINVTRNPMLRYWELVVRDLAIVYDLRNEAKVLRPTTSPGTGGLRNVTWTTIAEGVPCRMQPVSSTLQQEVAGKVAKRLNATCYLGEAIELQAGDVIEVGSVKYEAKSQSDISQFDTLTQVACERIT